MFLAVKPVTKSCSLVLVQFLQLPHHLAAGHRHSWILWCFSYQTTHLSCCLAGAGCPASSCQRSRAYWWGSTSLSCIHAEVYVLCNTVCHEVDAVSMWFIHSNRWLQRTPAGSFLRPSAVSWSPSDLLSLCPCVSNGAVDKLIKSCTCFKKDVWLNSVSVKMSHVCSSWWWNIGSNNNSTCEQWHERLSLLKMG